MTEIEHLPAGTRVRVNDRNGLIFRGELGTIEPVLFSDDAHEWVRLDVIPNTVLGYRRADLTIMEEE